MPVSLFSATVFSEAMWQRAWAAESNRSLRLGACMGAAGIIIVVFVFGMMGWLASWAGLIPYGSETDPSAPPAANANLYAFYVSPSLAD